MNTETTAQTLATHLLGQPVHQWISAQRDKGRSLRYISVQLHIATGGKVDVTAETIRQWMLEAVR